MTQRRANPMKVIARDRFFGLLAIVMASVLVTYAAAAASLPAPALHPFKAAANAAASGNLLTNFATVQTTSPVSGGARATDESPSRPAAVLASVTIQPSAAIAKSPELLQPTNKPAPRKLAAVSLQPRTRTLLMEVTGYCACKECCGPDARGVTASGKRVSYNGGKFVAADTDVLPFGTKLSIPGYNRGRPVPVADRGGAIEGRKLDLFFPTHSQAKQWGRQMVVVTIVE